MAEADGTQEDRTEAATTRRLQRAREEGQVPISRELASLAGLAGASIGLLLFAPSAAGGLARHLAGFLGQASALDIDRGVGGPLRLAGLAALRAAAPMALGAMLAGTLAVLLQTGLLLHSGRAASQFRPHQPARRPEAPARRRGPGRGAEIRRQGRRDGADHLVGAGGRDGRPARRALRRCRRAGRTLRPPGGACADRRAAGADRDHRGGPAVGSAAPRQHPAHEPPGGARRAEGDRGRPQDQNAVPPTAHAAGPQAHAGRGAEGHGGDHQPDALRCRTGLRPG